MPSFDPWDFLRLAERLCSDGDYRDVQEAAVRASVSRAYYAIFLFLRELFRRVVAQRCQGWVVECYNDVVQSGLAHSCIKRLVSSCDHSLGKLYGKLFLLRKHSDYELSASLSCDDAEYAIEIARRLAERAGSFDAVPSGKMEGVVLEHYRKLVKSRGLASES